jgi:hypothetical protein
MTTGAFLARIPGIDAGGDDALLPGFVFGVGEDASRDRERPFALPPAAIRALFWSEFP